jgi:hypothetical protein
VDQPTDNKQLRIYNKNNQYSLFSVDEVIANNLNKWKDWKCSAGVRSLYIDYDGNVWIANCASASHYGKVHDQRVTTYTNQDPKLIDRQWQEYRESIIGADGSGKRKDWINANTENGWPMPKHDYKNSEQQHKLMAEIGRLEKIFFDDPYKQFMKDPATWQWKAQEDTKAWGLQGSIFTGWETPKEWTTCPLTSCGCGADVILSKAKDELALENLNVTKYGYNGQDKGQLQDAVKNPHIAFDTIPVGIEMNFPIDYQILWDITRRCNYDCDYCWPSVHNNTEEHHAYNKIIETIDKAIDTWSKGASIRWNFGGGEPTMNPKFLDILKHLKERKQWTLVTTNGSRSTKYWKEACQYINSVNMSAHFGSMDLYKGNEQRFIENCKIIINHHKSVNDDFWLEIKLMTPPGMLERAQLFNEKIIELGIFNKGANGRQIGATSLVPIRGIDDSSELVGYSDNEIKFFQQQS